MYTIISHTCQAWSLKLDAWSSVGFPRSPAQRQVAKLQTYLTCAQASNHASVIYIFKTNQLDPRSNRVFSRQLNVINWIRAQVRPIPAETPLAFETGLDPRLQERNAESITSVHDAL